MSVARFLTLVLCCLVATRAYVLVNDSPNAAHPIVQAVAQQFVDRAGKPSVDAAVPFALPVSAGNCTGALLVSGAFRAAAESGSPVPGAMIFGLGQGPAPPNALGPASMRISWTMNSTTTGFGAALVAGGNASNGFTFTMSLRLTPLVPLPPGQVYWLTLHASLADSNGAANNRFYWRMLDASYVTTGTGSALPSSLRDPSNILGRNWTAWTAASTVAQTLFSTSDAASAAPRFAVRVEATSCTGDAVQAPVVVATTPPTVASPPVINQVPSPRVVVPSPPNILPPPPLPAPVSTPAIAPDPPTPLPGTETQTPISEPDPVPSDAAFTPSGNTSAIGNESLLFTTPAIIGIIVSSALVFGALMIGLVMFVRRWLNLRRIARGGISMREFEQRNGNGSYAGGVIPLGSSTHVRSTGSLQEHVSVSLDGSSDPGSTDQGNGANAATPLVGKANGRSGVPALQLRDSNGPWIPAGDNTGMSYTALDANGGQSGNGTPRSARLIADDDDPATIGNMTVLPRKTKAGTGLGASPRRLKKHGRRASATQPDGSDEEGDDDVV